MSLITAPRNRWPVTMPPTSRTVFGLILLVVGVLLPALPAVAEHDCKEVRVQLPGGGYQITRDCAPHQDQGGGGGSGGSELSCEQFLLLDGVGNVVEDDQGRLTVPVWYVCSDGSEWVQLECVPALNPDPPGPSCDSDAPGGAGAEQAFDGLVQRAAARVDVPLPGLRHTFDRSADDGTIRAIVRAETWWWAEGSLQPITMYDEDGPVWVRVTATPGALQIDPGDGSGPFTCPSQLVYNRRVSYYDQVPGEPNGACVHVYEQVFDQVTATMSVTWTLTYDGFAPGVGAVSGSLGSQTREQTATFPVKEIQSVIVR